MKLAEALLERADLQKHIEQMQSRIVANASYQEGEPPTEDAAELIETCLASISRLEALVTAINVTNTAAVAADGRALTALLSSREALRLTHSTLTRAADAAASGPGYRQMRSELRQISSLPVKDIRERAESVAKQLRELDVLIQRTNWEADLQQ